MSEPYVPEPAPESDAYHDPLPARCPHCGRLLLRASLDAWRCTEHGIVRPRYGNDKR
jgi:hypothetical protein